MARKGVPRLVRDKTIGSSRKSKTNTNLSGPKKGSTPPGDHSNYVKGGK